VSSQNGLVARLRASWTAYKAAGGDREAAALSYFGFFALFPTILLAASVLGFAMRGDPAEDLRRTITEAVAAVLPGAEGMLGESLDAITRRAGTVGLVGLVGVAWSGLGAVGTLRGALDRIFHAEPLPGLKGKLRDARFAVAAGILLALSIGLASLTTGGADAAMGALGLPEGGARVLGAIVAGALAFAADVALFLLVFTALPDHGRGWRDVLGGAVLAAAGWWLLRTAGGWYVARSAAQASAAYGVAATTIGLLVAINLASRLTLLSATFAATSAPRPRPVQARARGPVPTPPTPDPSPAWVGLAVLLAGVGSRTTRRGGP